MCCHSGLNHLPRQLNDIVARVFWGDISVTTKKLRVRVRPIIVENLFASLDGPQGYNRETVIAVIDMSLYVISKQFFLKVSWEHTGGTHIVLSI